MNTLMKKRLSQISYSASQSTIVVNACDYDPEGETIGFNALIFASLEARKKKILRAKFSTLTTEELRESFRKLTPLDQKLADSGRMRHLTDFLWGVNLSRALTIASNTRGNTEFHNVTIGRVQGPALAFVVERELERLTHVPVPSWTITCTLEKSGREILSRYIDNPVRKQSLALHIHNSVSSSKKAIVKRVDKSSLSIPPRYPFDLGELQKEAFRIFKMSPKVTLSVAQKLYQNALISYPRTDSQKLPEKIGWSKIFGLLRTQEKYSRLISKLDTDPNRRKRPFEGPHEDPAHPAIYPTGEKPRQDLADLEVKIYDLIVRRFCNVFAPNKLVEKVRIIFDISTFDFLVEESTIRNEGWAIYYPFGRGLGESIGPSFSAGEELRVLSSQMTEDFDPLPARFTEGSLLAFMEKVRLGTKATRAETIATLVARGYVKKRNQELVATRRGMDLEESLEEISPEIISTKLTRDLEEKLESIREGTENDVDFVIDVIESLKPALKKLRNRKIGMEPATTKVEYANRIFTLILGNCPICKSGKLQLIRSPRSGKRFIRCTNYGKLCKSSSPALPKGTMVPSGSACPSCGWPVVTIRFDNLKEIRTCSNYSCNLRAKL